MWLYRLGPAHLDEVVEPPAHRIASASQNQ